jgi:hypothetical protein
MSIDKSIRQYYDVPGTKEIKDQLHKLAYITDKEAKILKRMGGIETRTPEGIPAYPGHHGSSGSSGGHRGGGADRDPPPAPSAPPSPPSGPPGGGDKRMTYTAPTVTTAVAPPSILSRPTPSTTIGPSLHGDTSEQKEADELNRQKELRDIIKQGQEEKYGPTADPTKFGETISKLDVAMSKKESDRTIDDKLAIEEWENEQDWDKVQDLADKGHSSDDIQKAMDKGLLTKASVIEQQGAQGLIERGLAAIMPKTKLESSLLSNLTSKFDPKSIAGNMLKSAAKSAVMKKLGLGSFNLPFAIGSWLFGKLAPGKKEALTSKFAKKPTDMSAFNKLGLYDAGISTTDTAKRVGEKTIGSDIALGKKGVFESGQELLGLKDIEGHRAEVTKQDLAKYTNRTQKSLIDAQDYDSALDSGTINPDMSKYEFQQMKKGTITEPGTYIKGETGPIMVGAKGGRVDKTLSGRSRDI